jgi:hypothetical protein
MALMLLAYVAFVVFFQPLDPEVARVWPLRWFTDYLRPLFPGWKNDLDLPILGVLFAAFVVTMLLIRDDRWQRLSPGFLGNTFIEKRFARLCPGLDPPRRSEPAERRAP